MSNDFKDYVGINSEYENLLNNSKQGLLSVIYKLYYFLKIIII